MRTRTAATAALLSAVCAAPAAAQTDYYNTDAGRPLRIEDAAAVERYAFELQLAPLRVTRASGGAYHWEVEPELAYGILPRTQVEVGVPITYLDGAGGGTLAVAGLHLGALHALNTETRIPALALGAGVTLPVGGLGPDAVYGSLTGIATRTFRPFRAHLNGQVTFGPEPAAGESAGEASRWMAGIAVDRALPLRSLLLMADVFAEQPLDPDAELAWTAEAGFRYQTSPQFNTDLGIGRRFAGDEPGWFLTVGMAHAFSLRSLMPGGAR